MPTKIILQWLNVLSGLPRNGKRAIVVSIDATLLLISIWVAYSLRISVWVYWDYAIQSLLIGTLPIMLASFALSGMYRSIFRFAGIGMLRVIGTAMLVYTVITAALFMAWGFEGIPRTLGLLQPMVFFLLVLASRALFRLLMVDVRGRRDFVGIQKRVLIYGAGVSGQQLASSIRSDPEMRAVGFVDDDLRLVGQKLDGERIYGSDRLADAIETTGATDVLLAMPSASRKRRKAIVSSLSEYEVTVRTLPHIADVLGGQLSISDIRPLEIEDLLGRDPVPANEILLRRTVEGKAVLVTGAGGSIGSELCRQIVQIGAATLVLYEMTEFALYAIERELAEIARNQPGRPTAIRAILGTVADREALEDVMRQYEIKTVFHAAAYKHVPLVEANPIEGVRNNVIGTYNCCIAAKQSGVLDFILISTDKAVRPTNIMGASKRAAEQIIQAMNAESDGFRCSMVRFGNVLGSSGSVVPLFREQIEVGGPVTLTDKRITRFFMTIPEASNLVIQAAGLAKGGEVFVLNMGKPVKILDLAKTMIQLSGLSLRDEDNPEGDIEIQEIGLRPGEKLYEELLIGENPEKTVHSEIMKAHETFVPWPALLEWVSRVEQARDPADVLSLLQELVPEFQHRRNNHAA
ncbi:polysaccharide biosynthesis protein [Parerythrobacter jejuensis]|uniref:NAD-dependent epimerase/dehydratase family protein n=1 Tax=Parerythrobacter jejuensis TaxID=795812 RepID=A0A845APS0_9SPHN|nr:nucleoside-diphosphate sugar epimerase/dehydratase [Parerythrobacter jejuensis]MXP30871.1 NAD-dependent epimerase/dehydratase family protein [Parerythrobacter jejuensis]MXP33631.1 NAD-dependent epimerase/dehydratase family protein [Parerythrobacter jejuensis]